MRACRLFLRFLVAAISTVEIARPQRLVLYGEPWEAYVRLLRLFDQRRHLRISYDRGTLEIMTLSPEDEQWKRLTGRLIVTLTEEMGLPVIEYGSMTIKRKKNGAVSNPTNASGLRARRSSATCSRMTCAVIRRFRDWFRSRLQG